MCDNENLSSSSKNNDSYSDRASSMHPSSSLSYPPNVTLCYPAQNQLSPLGDGQSTTYLVPPSMASPSSCLAMAPQQMYTNYPSPYYRSMLGTQQGYYGSILSPAGHHPSSAFYGTFYNHSSSPVYPTTGQAPNMALTPMNYYSPTIYMQNHDSHLQTVWNGPGSHTNSKRTTLNYESTQTPPSCSKTDAEYPLPTVNDTTAEATVEEARDTVNYQTVPLLDESRKTPDVASENVLSTTTDEQQGQLEETNSVSSVEQQEVASTATEEHDKEVPSDESSSVSTTSENSTSPSPQFNFITRELSEPEYLPDPSFDKFDAALGCTTPLENFPDQGLQCLLCKNIDHLLPRPDVLQSIEPIVGRKIPSSLTKSVLICTQCDLILERYASLEKEVENLKFQIRSMYEANRADEQEEEVESQPMLDKENSSPPDEVFNTTAECSSFHRCPDCGKNFLDPTCLKRHLKSHSKEALRHLCELCGQGFGSKMSLRKHVKQYHSSKLLECNICRATFSQRTAYVKHRKEHGPLSRLLCDTCGKAFPHRSALKVHLRVHSGEKPFSCNSCGKSFNVKSNLVAHIPCCTGQMPHTCGECGKGFSTKHLYETHMKAHRGNYAVKCEICGMGFAKRSLYVAHQRTHTKEKPYLCHVCGRGFSSVGNCNSHAKTHNNERNFVCEICGKKFARKTGLEAHLNRHRGNKPFPCSRCDKAFSDASNLLNHLKTHRDNMENQ